MMRSKATSVWAEPSRPICPAHGVKGMHGDTLICKSCGTLVEPSRLTSAGVQALVERNHGQQLLREWDAYLAEGLGSEACKTVMGWTEEEGRVFADAYKARIGAPKH